MFLKSSNFSGSLFKAYESACGVYISRRASENEAAATVSGEGGPITGKGSGPAKPAIRANASSTIQVAFILASAE